MSSGASTPRNSMTPPPGEGPSPLSVGTRFVKQYYQMLSTNSDQIVRFYQPSSVLSVGVSSDPADDTQQQEAAQRFQLDNDEKCSIRFEFEHGAIDAQVSVNGGILLVVTGHIVYLKGDEEEEEIRRRAFVHTFFLGTAGHKRNFYVHNDILRFLHEDVAAAPVIAEETTAVASNTSESKSAAIAPPTSVVEVSPSEPPTAKSPQSHTAEVALETIAEPALPVTLDHVVEPAVVAPSPEQEAPGNGVEESKEAILEGGGEEEAPKAKPAPGSWASLVASNNTALPASPPPGTPKRGDKTPTIQQASPVKSTAAESPKRESTAASSKSPHQKSSSSPTTTNSNSRPQQQQQQRKGQRDPDMTLVIKNIDASTVESEILGLFETYAKSTGKRIVGCTVSAHRGIAFVDYDSAEPVVAAVEAQSKNAFFIRERKLEIYQKTAEQRSRGGGGGSSRGGGGGGGRSGFRGSGRDFRGSGRGQHRRGSGGRSDRVSGGGRGESSGRGGRGGGR